ncbi:MAG: membrane dipeptidase [Saprospiraceae bacterium]
MIHYPIVDLHCDLLLYLAKAPGAHINGTKDIGVTLPYLKAGNVRHQILAIFVPTGPGSVALAQKELEAYQNLLQHPDFYPITTAAEASGIATSSQIGVTVAIENASVFCEEDEPLALAFQRFDNLLEACGHFFYIGFTHHTENRFGGGNYSNNVGLKEDGKRLLEYMAGKAIAVDLAHASDNLAHGIINYITSKSLDVPVIASHSNFRSLTDHVRNLPNELVKEVVKRQGLIGMNFLRDYIHPSDPSFLLAHIKLGLQADVALDQLAFGADFFYRPAISVPERVPLFFPEHEDAGKYPVIIDDLSKAGIETGALEKLCYKNVLSYIERNW